MMVPAALLLLASLSAPQEEEGETYSFFQARGGLWVSGGFDFEAVRLDGRHKVEGRGLYSGGADAGVVLVDHYMLFATYEASAAGDVFSDLVGLSAGYRLKVKDYFYNQPPMEASVFGGVIWGRFEVDETGFGDFEDSIGGRAGLALSWTLAESLRMTAVLEYRRITFEYEPDIISGDDRAGGSSVWAGLGLELRL
jgi:hypothetical protein